MTLRTYPNKFPTGPQHLITDVMTSSWSRNRYVVRRGWNGALGGSTVTGTNGTTRGIAVTPFRAVNNAGDPLVRENYSCGGPTQTNASKPGLKNLIGHITKVCDNTTIENASCNVKYVYDSSNYSRFKKEQALNRNYNDNTYGGDEYSAAQSAIWRIRR